MRNCVAYYTKYKHTSSRTPLKFWIYLLMCILCSCSPLSGPNAMPEYLEMMHLSPAPFVLLQNQSVDQQRKHRMFSTMIRDSLTNQMNMIISSTILTAVSSYGRKEFPPRPSTLTTPTSTTCIPKNFMGTNYNLTLISPTCYPRMLLLSSPSLRNIGVFLTIVVLSHPFAIISASLILALPHQLPLKRSFMDHGKS
jgi:hypothetical protein